MNSFFKKIILVIFATLSSRLSATHNRSGEIIYKRIPPYSQTVGTVTTPVFTYSITVIKYFDFGPQIADRCADTVYFGDGTMAVAQRINGINNCGGGCPNCGEIIVISNGFNIKKNIFSCVHTYSGSGVYYVSSSDVNRSQGVYNIPNSDQVPFSIQSMIVINANAINSSPVLTNPPMYQGTLQRCFNFNPCAFDPDGDSLSYELVPCNAPGYFDPPAGPNGTFSIDPGTGMLSWCNPQLSATYNMAIRVKEWRKNTCNGQYQLVGYVTRDMQVVILSSPPISFTASVGADDCVVAGSNFSRNVSSSFGSGISAFVGLFGRSKFTESLPVATLSSTFGLTTLTSIFSWQTNCTHVQKAAYPIHFVYQVSNQIINNLAIYAKFNLKVIPPAPAITNVINNLGNVTLIWNPITSCATNLIGYNIYRKIGGNSWAPSNCETGAPPNSGFVFLGTAPANANSYTDNNFYSVNSGSTGNYFVTSLMKDCAESYASNIETLTILVGSMENRLIENFKISPNPFTKQIELELPNNGQENIEVLIYAVDGKQVYKSLKNNSDAKIILELNDLDRGLYILQFKIKDAVVSKKIIRS